ncbi:MAG: cation diffusion facilitator family transporter, partial [Akkermansia sp.]
MDQAAHHEKSRAAFSSVLWSAFLTGIKIWAGVKTGSLGIISEALHSGLDLMAAGMTFYAVRIAARPADESHPYGHEKIENLSALAETALLLITCGWIVWEAIDRLFYNEAEITLTWWAFAVVAVSLLVDVNRSAMLRRVAKKHKSQALEADALHFT